MPSRIGTVVRIRPNGANKSVELDSGETLRAPRYSIVGKGAVLWRDGHGVFVAVRNGRARVLPAYSRVRRLQIGSRMYAVRVKEIDEGDELEAYLRLGDLHYRTDKGFGRKAVLVVKASSPELPRILGYVELTTGFLMNKPRAKVLDSPFRDGIVSWSNWRSEEMRSLTSLVCRISRLVVHPELRGHGLGTLLTREAARFARTHFHAGGLRPLFLELTADMTKFVPFADRAGMQYVGNTEGNLHRVAQDMEYLLRKNALLKLPTNSLPARGILHAQRRYAAIAAPMAERDGLVALASDLAGLSGDIDSSTYARYFGVIRLPKPTFLMGLTSAAHNFVAARASALGVQSQPAFGPSPLEPISGPIELRGLGFTFESSVARTTRSTQIQEAFGIKPDHFRSLVAKGISASISPGSVTLLFGPSGSGKTTLLNVLAGLEPPLGLRQDGSLTFPRNIRTGRFEPLPASQPLIEVLGAGSGIGQALYALNVAGLSDAKLYLRRFSELSNGQRYRAMLAALIDSDANVWMADEFLSTLDPITAVSVASNIVDHVRARNVTLIVGAPHYDTFLEVLDPDLVLRLVSPWEHEVLDGRAFTRRWRRQRTRS